MFHMGSGAISWASKKQPVVSLSTAEAEYVATTAAACQAVSLRRVLSDSKNSVFHKRTKHIDTKFHFIHELVNNGEIVL